MDDIVELMAGDASTFTEAVSLQLPEEPTTE
jgi:hypothetical protein